MLGPIGTIAFQTMGPTLARKRQDAALGVTRTKPPRIDTCHAMASDGEGVKTRWPEFYTGDKK